MKKVFSVKYLFFLLSLATIIIYFFNHKLAFGILLNSKAHLLETLSLVPPILIIIRLFQVWVPRKTFERTRGETSGLRGILMAILVGTVARGPLYAAFPLGVSLLDKGAILFNTAIFLCAWASIKIPMILFEIEFLGLDFAGLRLSLTLTSILLISFILNFILKEDYFHEKAKTP